MTPQEGGANTTSGIGVVIHGEGPKPNWLVHRQSPRPYRLFRGFGLNRLFALGLAPAEQEGLQTVEIEIDDGRGVEREYLLLRQGG
jgi:hypothetical protein